MTQLTEILRRKPEGGGPLFGPFVGPASNKNDHQGYLLWGKGSRCVGLTSSDTFVCRISRNSESSASWRPKGLSRPVDG